MLPFLARYTQKTASSESFSYIFCAETTMQFKATLQRKSYVIWKVHYHPATTNLFTSSFTSRRPSALISKILVINSRALKVWGHVGKTNK